MKRLRSVHHGIGNQVQVECSEFTSMCFGEREQIAVGHLRGIQKSTAGYAFGIPERDVVRPEVVAGQRTQLCQQL